MKNITLSTIIYIGVIVAGIITSYAVMKTQVTMQIATQETRLNKLENKVDPIPERLMAIETKVDMVLKVLKR